MTSHYMISPNQGEGDNGTRKPAAESAIFNKVSKYRQEYVYFPGVTGKLRL